MNTATEVGIITGGFTIAGITINQILGIVIDAWREKDRRRFAGEAVALDGRVALRMVDVELRFAEAAYEFMVEENLWWGEAFTPRVNDWQANRERVARALDAAARKWVAVSSAYVLIETELRHGHVPGEEIQEDRIVDVQVTLKAIAEATTALGELGLG